MRVENISTKLSYQQTANINRVRATGVEPSINYSDKAPNVDPKKFVADMPVMPKYDRHEARRKRNYEKQLLNCKHVWLTLTDLPLYKCNECGNFLRIEK